MFLCILKTFLILVNRHLNRVQRTREIEVNGKQLVASNFKEELLKSFIHDVCYWGGRYGPAICSRVFNNNDISWIRKNFIAAWNLLSSKYPNVREALINITKINHLGISFSSKQLRFLYPQCCPVLDKVIRNKVGKYLEDFDSYEQFSRDCLEVAKILENNKIKNPMNRDNGKWYAADIEMAIFEHIFTMPSGPGGYHCRGKS